MRKNRMREIWADDGCVLTAWLLGNSAYSAEVIANEKFDAVVVDMQHGIIDFQSAAELLQAISTKAPVPIARTPWNDPSPIMRLLDAGAYGIICPMVNNRAECEQFISACRYPPAGERSYGPLRAMLYAGEDYYQHANDTISTIAMIETAAALDNLDDIMSVDGLDAIYIGPSDLSIALGHEPTLDPKAKVVLDAIDAIRDAAVRHGVQPGIHAAGGEGARAWREQGFRFIALAADSFYLAEGARAQLRDARA